MRSIPRVQTESREVNQLQQNIIPPVESAIGALESPDRYGIAALPAAPERFAWARVKDPGAAEVLKVSLQSADGTWAWVTVATAP